jgi:nitrogen regulatory protein P-II 1
MKEIKAFIHRNRVADVVRALARAGFRRLSLVDVKGMLGALDKKEQEYSIEIGDGVITEVKLEVVCENETRTLEAIRIIEEFAETGQAEAGWIFVADVEAAVVIGGAKRAGPEPPR